MNKRLLIVVLFIAVGVVGTITYFKYFKSGDQLRVIPKDAAVVVSFDMKSLAEKAQPEKLKAMKFYKKMMEEMDKDSDAKSKFAKRVLQTPGITGINFLQNMYFFMAVRNDEPVIGFTATMMNEKTFESFLDSLPDKKAVTDKGAYKFIRPDSGIFIAWDNKRALFLTIKEDKIDGKSYLDELMGQNAANSISANDNFNKFSVNGGDLTAFINYNQWFQSMSRRAGMQMAKLPDFFTDFYKSMYAGMSLDFEKNSIVMKNFAYYDGKYNDDKYKVLKSKGLTGDELNSITDKNIYALMSVSIDVKKVMAMIENESSVNTVFTEIQSQLGLSKDDVKNLFGGDITIALTDIRNSPESRKTYDYDEKTGQMSQKEVMDTTLMPMFTLNISINDKSVLHKIIDKTGLQKTDNYYKINVPYLTDICMVETSTGVSLTNDKGLATKLSQAKSLAAAPEKVKGLLSDNPMSMYMDFDLTDYPQAVKDKMGKEMGVDMYGKVNNVMSLFKEVKGSGNLQGGKAELTLTDGKDNSLYRIIERIDANVNY